MALPITPEAEQEFKKYFKNRPMTPTDMENYNRDPDIFKKSYSSITGVGTDTAGGAGAGAGDVNLGETELEQTEGQAGEAMTTQQQMETMTGEGSKMETILQKALQAKSQEEAPINEKRAGLTEKLGTIKMKDYAKLSPDAALRAIEQDSARLRSRISYLDQQKADMQNNLADIVEQTRGMFGDKLNALGLKLQSEQEAVDFAFNPMILLSGTIPPNVPEQYIPAWEAASDEAKRQQALAEAPRGGGGGGRGGSTKDPYEKDARDFIFKLSAKEISWADAWNTMKALHPELTNEQIDGYLGGAAQVPDYSQAQSTAEGDTGVTYKDYGLATVTPDQVKTDDETTESSKPPWAEEDK